MITIHGAVATPVALVAACFVFARRLSPSRTTSLGTASAIAGAVAFTGVTAVGVRLLAQSVTGRT